MFVRCKKRFKDGKEHRYWSVVENVRVSGGRVVQRQVLYLGEINDSQRAAWCRSIEVVEGASRSKQVALFPEDREAPELECEVVQVRLAELTLHAPRQWGACWLALTLWERLELDRFWGLRLPASREGTRWLDILKIQVCYRLIDPGSDWRIADFLLPDYDIMFSNQAASYKRRRKHKRDRYEDFSMLPTDRAGPIVFLGGTDYVAFFCSLTRDVEARRIVFHYSGTPPRAMDCELRRFEAASPRNWHYECASALIRDRYASRSRG